MKVGVYYKLEILLIKICKSNIINTTINFRRNLMSKTKLTRRILTGLVLLVGASGAVTVANEVNNVAVNVNKKDVKASVYEKNGHYYVKLTTVKNVTNVVARVTTEDRKEYVV